MNRIFWQRWHRLLLSLRMNITVIWYCLKKIWMKMCVHIWRCWIPLPKTYMKDVKVFIYCISRLLNRLQGKLAVRKCFCDGSMIFTAMYLRPSLFRGLRIIHVFWIWGNGRCVRQCRWAKPCWKYIRSLCWVSTCRTASLNEMIFAAAL